MRKSGIPTVLDRLVQQAVQQVLQQQWDPTFSEHSYGFRPGRPAHQAVAQAQQHVAAGHGWRVNFDWERFFERVNHDKPMGQLIKRISDEWVLKLIRAILNAEVVEDGLVSPSVEGAPQGGHLSPLVCSLVLDELDRGLERRDHRFVRYADDCNIHVRSGRAGQRVREITRTARGRSMEHVMEELARYPRGWRAYFGCCETPVDSEPLGLVDPEEYSMRLLAAVENGPHAICGTGPTGREPQVGGEHRRFPPRPVAFQPEPSSDSGPVELLSGLAWTSDVGSTEDSITRRTAVYGTVCTVV